MSSERDAAKRAFLAEAGLGAARREILAGDASTRRYERLHRPDGARYIFIEVICNFSYKLSIFVFKIPIITLIIMFNNP